MNRPKLQPGEKESVTIKLSRQERFERSRERAKTILNARMGTRENIGPQVGVDGMFLDRPDSGCYYNQRHPTLAELDGSERTDDE